MVKFELTKAQQERSDAWFKHHWDVVHKDWRPRDMSGFACEYVFGPTGYGCNVKIQCVWCAPETPQRECILTEDFDSGDLIYQYDENWVRLPASWKTKVTS